MRSHLIFGAILFVAFALIHTSASTQKFRPDAYGYVSDKKFKAAIASRGYQLVTAFDTIDFSQPLVWATVLKNDTLKYIDLNLTEYPYKTAYDIKGDKSFDSLKRIWNFHEHDLSKKYKVTRNSNGKVGLVNTVTGKAIVEEQYDGLQPHNNGYIYYAVSNKWGALDSNGAVVIPAMYNNINSTGRKPFQVDYFIVRDSLADGIDYLIDKNNRQITEKHYSNVGPSGTDLFWGLKKGDGQSCWVLINERGKELTTTCITSILAYRHFGWFVFERKVGDRKLYSIADERGRILVDSLADLDFISTSPFQQKDFICAKFWGQSKFCALDRSGQIRIPSTYDQLQYLDKAAVFKASNILTRDNVFGLIDTNNKILISLDYTAIYNISGPYFLLKKSDSSWIYDCRARTVIPVPYRLNRFDLYRNAQLTVSSADGYYGTIDCKGSVVIPLQYRVMINDFKYYYTNKGIINKEGQLVMDKPYQREDFTFNPGPVPLYGIFRFGVNKEKTLLVDRYGNQVVVSPNTSFRWWRGPVGDR